MNFILTPGTATLREKCPTVSHFGFNFEDTLRFEAAAKAGQLGDFTVAVMVVVFRNQYTVKVQIQPGTSMLWLESTGEGKPNPEEWADLEYLATTYMDVAEFKETVFEGTRAEMKRKAGKAQSN